MARWPAPDDEDEDDWSPDDSDLPDGVYHDDELPTVPCPRCRREVLEDVSRCPYCETYLSAEDSPRRPRSWFWLAMMAAALAIAALWVI